ncbi:IucA/IucC family protein, partial [Ralstonia solanacearum]
MNWAVLASVWAASSVRTVWLPLQRQFLKLSLDVRITNFVR